MIGRVSQINEFLWTDLIYKQRHIWLISNVFHTQLWVFTCQYTWAGLTSWVRHYQHFFSRQLTHQWLRRFFKISYRRNRVELCQLFRANGVTWEPALAYKRLDGMRAKRVRVNTVIFGSSEVESLVVISGINSKMELNSGEVSSEDEVWVKVASTKMSVVGWNVIKVRLRVT